MHRLHTPVCGVLSAVLTFSTCAVASAAVAPPPLVPEPQSIQMEEGTLALTSASRVIAAQPALAPLAKVLSNEIYLATGLRLAVASGEPAAGDIVLKLSETHGKNEEAYTLKINNHQAVVTADSYVGAAWGTVTLLQSLNGENGKTVLPCLSIDDAPRFPYRGFMKDVARQDVPIEQLFAAVNLCRQYKVRYLHLHLSDDHAWVFPSTKYPKLGSVNRGAHSGPAPKVYDLARLKELVHYADERGVTIIPEIDGPGHTDALRMSMPDLFDSPQKPGGRARLGLVNMTNEKMYAAMDDILGEVADVFASSPYIHIGADEVNTGAIKGAAGYEAFLKAHDLKSPHDVFIYYIKRMAEIVEKHGKTPIAWEGVPMNAVDPHKMVYMAWTNSSEPAKEAIKRGFRVINAPNSAFFGQQEIADKPLFRDGARYNFNRDLYAFGKSDKPSIDAGNPLMIGEQINDWESTWEYSLPVALRAVPAASANAWKSTTRQSFDQFAPKLAVTNALLERVMEPITIKWHSEDTFDQKDAVQKLRANVLFVKPETLTATTTLPDATIHYTTDGTIPTVQSTPYTKPLVFDKTTMLWMALFDKAGNQLAPAQRVPFEKINYEKSLTTGKPVTATGHQGKDYPSYLVDGFARFDIWRGWWGANPVPQSATIDLEKPERINRIEVFPYWDGHRSYQYTVDVSTDQKDWKTVVDMSKNKRPSTSKGDDFTFDIVTARYIRITVTKNTANSAAHIVDLRAFGPEK